MRCLIGFTFAAIAFLALAGLTLAVTFMFPCRVISNPPDIGEQYMRDARRADAKYVSLLVTFSGVFFTLDGLLRKI